MYYPVVEIAFHGACVRVCVHACMRACVRACMRACVRACVRAWMHACVCACVRVRACVWLKKSLAYIDLSRGKRNDLIKVTGM